MTRNNALTVKVYERLKKKYTNKFAQNCKFRSQSFKWFIHVREISEKFIFFKVKELSENSVICQGKLNFAKKFREFTFQLFKATMFGADLSFLLNS